jgi:SAM-dependent methyltransferase
MIERSRVNPKSPVKMNIGSGPHGLPDWINLDWGLLALLDKMPTVRQLVSGVGIVPATYCVSWPSHPRLWNCTWGLPFPSGSGDFIYTSHFLEHLHRYQCQRLLTECRRVLSQSGVLRISIPDVRLLAEKYVQNDADFFLRSEDSRASGEQLRTPADLFVKHFYGYDSWSKPSAIERFQRRFIRGHLWMYDYVSLSELLHTAGFARVQLCEPGAGQVPDIEYLDIHRDVSLFVEVWGTFE